MEDLRQDGVHTTFNFHPHPTAVPHRPEGTGEAQQHVFRLLPHREQCEAGLCVRPYLVCDLLQYDSKQDLHEGV